MDTCAHVARSIQQVLKMIVNSHTTKRGLHRGDLYLQKKMKKTHISSKNVEAHLEFVKVHEQFYSSYLLKQE